MALTSESTARSTHDHASRSECANEELRTDLYTFTRSTVGQGLRDITYFRDSRTKVGRRSRPLCQNPSCGSNVGWRGPGVGG